MDFSPMHPCRVAIIFGTRPETIKIAPIALRMQQSPHFTPVLVATAQHRELLDQVADIFHLQLDADLNIMQVNQSLFDIVKRILHTLPPVIESIHPDWILVQGDTTTAFASALVAAYLQIPLAHIEAGLRTHDKRQPFPEELNRRLISPMADLHFSPTHLARKNLLDENVPDEHIHVTGNTVIDALDIILQRTRPQLPEFLHRNAHKRLLLVTVHRRENWGEPIRHICRALKTIMADNPDVLIVFSVHPNPIVRSLVLQELGDISRTHLLPPLDYPSFIHLMSQAEPILTDSGGIQEEAPSLGKPVLVLREVTERPEGVAAGVLKLVGVQETAIVESVNQLLHHPHLYNAMSERQNPYGDGHAAERILNILQTSHPCSASRKIT